MPTTRAVVDLLAARAPGLLRVLLESNPDFVLLGGTLAECDRVGDSRADYSAKHRRHGVNVQVVTDSTGEVLWISPTLPGRVHDLTAARTHRIIRICERQGVPVLADRAYQGVGPWVTTGLKRPPGGELTPTQRTTNRALSQARAPVERGMPRLKSWRIFRRSRVSPNRMTSIARAVLTLERQRRKRSVCPTSPHRSTWRASRGLRVPRKSGTATHGGGFRAHALDVGAPLREMTGRIRRLRSSSRLGLES